LSVSSKVISASAGAVGNTGARGGVNVGRSLVTVPNEGADGVVGNDISTGTSLELILASNVLMAANITISLYKASG